MFKNREEAGKKLATHLIKYHRQKDCFVIGLARGGVVVAAKIAQTLLLPLNVLVPRKIGAPDNPELALGAILETGDGYFNESLIRELGVSKQFLAKETKVQQAKAEERQTLYAKYIPRPVLKGKTVILVDDGIATGATMFACIESIRKQKPAFLIVAIPLGPPSTIHTLQKMADEVVCLETENFGSVSMSYEDFSQVEDEDVIALLKQGNYNK